MCGGLVGQPTLIKLGGSMCFFVDGSEKLTAKEDVTCYKVTFADCESVCRGYEYPDNSLQPYVNLTIEVDMYINEGYHSYISLAEAEDSPLCFDEIWKFIIPKGTKYYINELEGEYVSETIQRVERVR